MKKLSTLKKFSTRIMFFIFISSSALVFTACSSSSDDNDDEPIIVPSSSYKEILGTFKGTLHTYGDGKKDYYNAEITITDAGNGKIRIAPKPNQPYSSATPKEIKVNPVIDGYIQGIEAQGNVSYDINKNYLIVTTEKSKETDVDFSFEGSKIK